MKIPTFKPAWTFLFLIFIALILLNLKTGTVNIPFKAWLHILQPDDPSPLFKEIILQFRLPKTITSILAGGALAISGLFMQTFFRNPLAGPDVLGLSSGASLAVSFIYMSNVPLLFAFGDWLLAGTASLGCALVFFIVILAAKRTRNNVSLLIIGLMIGAITSSLVSILQLVSRAEEQKAFLLWTFGNVGNLNWDEIKVVAALTLIGSGVATTLSKPLNGWLLGDNYAQSLGINLKKARFSILVTASLLTGTITAFCGPIAFVGLAVPHLVKLVVPTTDHKKLIPLCFITGSSLLLLCDTLSQLPGNGLVLPLNAITAMVGAPVVIWVVLKGKQ